MYLCTKENIMHHPEIAIVDPNTLTCLGLKNILEDIIPMATIRVFHSFGELTDDTPDMYAHYFISAQIYFEHTSFFLLRKPKTIVLAGDDSGQADMKFVCYFLIDKSFGDKYQYFYFPDRQFMFCFFYMHCFIYCLFSCLMSILA